MGSYAKYIPLTQKNEIHVTPDIPNETILSNTESDDTEQVIKLLPPFKISVVPESTNTTPLVKPVLSVLPYSHSATLQNQSLLPPATKKPIKQIKKITPRPTDSLFNSVNTYSLPITNEYY